MQQIAMLLKKEIRETWPITALFVFVEILIFTNAIPALVNLIVTGHINLLSAVNSNEPYLTFFCGYISVMSAICYCREFERGRINILRLLPISSTTLMISKLLNIFIGASVLALFGMIFTALKPLPVPAYFPEILSGYLMTALEFFLWGLFWSTILKSQFESLILAPSFALAFSFVILPRLGRYITGPQSDFTSSLGIELRLFFAVILFIAVCYRLTHWFKLLEKRESNSTAMNNDFSVRIEFGSSFDSTSFNDKTKNAGPFWTLFREGYRSLSFKINMTVLFSLFYCVNCYCRFLPNQYMSSFLLVIVAFLFTTEAFFSDLANRRIQIFQRFGITPGQYWRSRLCLFGGIFFLFAFLVFNIHFGHGYLLPHSFFLPDEAATFNISEYIMFTFVFGTFVMNILASGLFFSVFHKSRFFAYLSHFVLLLTLYILCILSFALKSVLLGFLNFSILLLLFYSSFLLVKDRFFDRDQLRFRMKRALVVFVPLVLFIFTALPLVYIHSVPLIPEYANDNSEEYKELNYYENSINYLQERGKNCSLQDIQNLWNIYSKLDPKAFPRNPVYFNEKTIYDWFNNYKTKQIPAMSNNEIRESIKFLLSIPQTRPDFERQAQAFCGFYLNYNHDKESMFFFLQKIRDRRLLSCYGKVMAKYGAFYESTFYRNETSFSYKKYIKFHENNLPLVSVLFRNRYYFNRCSFAFDIINPETIRNTELKRTALVLKLAITLFRNEKGTWPESLDKLIEFGYLKEIPAVPGIGPEQSISFLYSAKIFDNTKNSIELEYNEGSEPIRSGYYLEIPKRFGRDFFEKIEKDKLKKRAVFDGFIVSFP